MIRPPGWDGVAFSDRSDGDLRNDDRARQAAAQSLGINRHWATVRQVHGDEVLRVSAAGDAGEADALWTTAPGLPIAVFTADCFGVVLTSKSGAAGVAHAGWRGAAASVVTRLAEAMSSAGHTPERAATGPGIGPCCFEVGADVAAEFPGHVTETTWRTTSVDLPAVIAAQLEGVETWASGRCTLHEEHWFSHREDRTTERMAAIGWVP